MVVIGTIRRVLTFALFVNLNGKKHKEEKRFLIVDKDRAVIGAYEPGLGTMSIEQLELEKKGDYVTSLPHSKIGASMDIGKDYYLVMRRAAQS